MDPQEDEHLPAYMTPLYLAVFIDHDFEKAQDLISSGHAIDDEPTDDGYTLLHRAVQSGDIKALKFFLKHECSQSINSFDYIEHTPLIWAASEGRLEIARLLIKSGADVNAHHEEKIGNTAIREAVRAGDLKMCELLLGSGADPSILGWMQIDAILQARLSFKEDPESEIRAQILSLVSNHKK
jgi:ankyrin repeat protein